MERLLADVMPLTASEDTHTGQKPCHCSDCWEKNFIGKACVTKKNSEREFLKSKQYKKAFSQKTQLTTH